MTNKPLTLLEKQRIYDAIDTNKTESDKDPCEIIATTYNGDEEKYLRDMAKWLGVTLDNQD